MSKSHGEEHAINKMMASHHFWFMIIYYSLLLLLQRLTIKVGNSQQNSNQGHSDITRLRHLRTSKYQEQWLEFGIAQIQRGDKQIFRMR